MSKFRESEAVVVRCSSKKVLSKIAQIIQKLRNPQNLQEYLSLQNTSNNDNLWRKVKYDLV